MLYSGCTVALFSGGGGGGGGGETGMNLDFVGGISLTFLSEL